MATDGPAGQSYVDPFGLSLVTPLGDNVLLPTSVAGVEGISKLFRFEVSALAESTADVSPKTLLKQNVTLVMGRGEQPRFVNGIVTSLAVGPKMRSGQREYRMIIQPELWTMDLTAGYRTFQELNVPDILEKLLVDAEMTPPERALKGTYIKRDVCFQYAETSLAFFQRLLAEEGIYFYFKHEKGAHKLVLSDHVDAYQTGLDVNYHPDNPNVGNCVYEFEVGTSLVPVKWQVTDFNPASPDQLPKQTSDSKVPIKKSGLHHVYGLTPFVKDGMDTAHEGHMAKARMEASDADYEVGRASSTFAGFTPGYTFKLLSVDDDDELKQLEFVVTEIRHQASDTGRIVGSGEPPDYRNSFSCIPKTRLALVPPPTHKVTVRGPHTARVVGPANEEIYADKEGRIRVKFHWDMDAGSDEKSGCFVRLAHGLAGDSWGMMFVPRIGMEVVVHFIDGDPDRPLVTGVVYNGTHTFPRNFEDQVQKTTSGLITRSTPNGTSENANWLLFVDKKDAEKIDIQAEKDFLRTVKNDDKLDVKHDQTRTIKNNRTTTITEGNETFTIEKGNREVTIKTGNETLTIDTGNRTETIKTGNDALTISKGGRTVTLDQGDHELELTAGNSTISLSRGNQTTTLDSGNFKVLCTGGKITIEAMSGITLKCGQSKIELTPGGITINSVQVTVKGAAKAELAGPIVNVSGDAMANIKGGIVKIN